MRQYKGYFISGWALRTHGNRGKWRAQGCVLIPDRNGSVVEVKRIEGPTFQVNEEAEAHGLELCKAWIEERKSKSYKHSKAPK